METNEEECPVAPRFARFLVPAGGRHATDGSRNSAYLLRSSPLPSFLRVDLVP